MRNVLLLAALIVSGLLRAQNELPIEFKWGAGGGRPGCNCTPGSVPISFTIRWTNASCGSDCRSGFGIDCGLVHLIVCSNGKQMICPVSGPCQGNVLARQTTATLRFFDNQTVRLSFDGPLPEGDAASGFDVGSDLFLSLPEGLTIGGRAYVGYRIRRGHYAIDLADGRNGSVTIGVELVEATRQ